MSTVFTGMLDLRLRVSVWHRLSVAAIYVLAGGVCAALAAHRPWLWSVLAVIAIAGGIAYRRAALRAGDSPRQLRWHADGEWVWRGRGQAWHSGTRVDHFMLGTRLVVVTLRPRGARRRRLRCVLFNDSLAADTHRRLRARLTVAPAPRRDRAL